MLSSSAASQCCRRQLLNGNVRLFSWTSVPSAEFKKRGKSSKLSSLKPTEQSRPQPQSQSKSQSQSQPSRKTKTPREPFVREEMPHASVEAASEPGRHNASFRPRSARQNEMDWIKRRGTWGEALEPHTPSYSPRIRHEQQTTPNSKPKKYDSDSAGTRAPGRTLRDDQHDLQQRSTPFKPPFFHETETPSTQSSANSDVLEIIDPSYERPSFSSPPLLPGLQSCLRSMLGPDATPTNIQALSLNNVVPPYDSNSQHAPPSQWKEWLLASETGSGKSIAYLLPLLQSLKLSELDPSYTPKRPAEGKDINPRALILAPTHELARQLTVFAKTLQHEIKMRIMCASRANTPSSGQEKVRMERGMTASQMASLDLTDDGMDGLDVSRTFHQVDVLVGTPMKLLEMSRGRGWEKDQDGPGSASPVLDETLTDVERKLRRGRDRIEGTGRKSGKSGVMDLSNVEWVIVDEADVLFDPDFQETTRMLLSDIASAKAASTPAPPPATTSEDISVVQSTYPFNLLLTSATIPTTLHNYLSEHHPRIERLVSTGVHKLPKGLKVEYSNWTGGNRMADVEKRIRQVWAEDAFGTSGKDVNLSQVLVFCNKSTKVKYMGEYLESKGIKNVAVTSTGDTRARGSNKHLEGFLRVLPSREGDGEARKNHIIWDNESPAPSRTLKPILARPTTLTPTPAKPAASPKDTPHVLITTSLLSRGLDFAPSIRHVFVVDEPRNVLDFLHRAGRSARAGQKGRVVVFGKFPDSGRGAGRGREVKDKVGALVSRRRRR